MELLNGVLPSWVWKNVISNEKQKLLRATLTSLTYDNKKKQLKAIYYSSMNLASNNNIKEEQMFLTQEEKGHVGSERYPKDSKCNYGRYQKERYKGVAKNSSESFDKWGRKTKPKYNFGNVSHCAVCQSIYHWAKQCPDKRREEDYYIKSLCFQKKLMVVILRNLLVLNRGCTETVCGLSWLNIYLE